MSQFCVASNRHFLFLSVDIPSSCRSHHCRKCSHPSSLCRTSSLTAKKFCLGSGCLPNPTHFIFSCHSRGLMNVLLAFTLTSSEQIIVGLGTRTCTLQKDPDTAGQCLDWNGGLHPAPAPPPPTGHRNSHTQSTSWVHRSLRLRPYRSVRSSLKYSRIAGV